MSIHVDAFICEQRELLDRLEAFSKSPEFRVLSQAGRDVFQEPSDRDLARWLLQPIYGLDKRPIDLVGEQDGLAQVVNRLHRILHGVCV